MNAALLKVRAHQNNMNGRCRVRRGDEAAKGSDMAGQTARLKRDGEQSVDQAAIEDHDLFRKLRPAIPAGAKHDAVAITSGREQGGFAGMHDARDHEACLRLHLSAILLPNERGADQVPIALRLVDVCVAQ